MQSCTRGRTSCVFPARRAFGAAAAERVAEKDGVEAGIVGCVDPFLQVRAHA